MKLLKNLTNTDDLCSICFFQIHRKHNHLPSNYKLLNTQMVLSIKTIKGIVIKQYADFILKQSLKVVGMS